VVTGGAQGLGRAICERLMQEGCKVVIGDIQEEVVAKTAAEISAQPVSLTPPLLNFAVAAGGIQFGWPSTNTGWQLQVQTNDVTQGLGTNWWDVANSITTNQITIHINPASGSVFYRMIYP